MHMKIIARYFFILSIFISSVNCYSQSDNTLVIGEFKISKITDGDTFRIENLDKPTRLLGIDTEETFKTDDAGAKSDLIAQNWIQYYNTEKADSKMPVKTNSPLGYEAWKWAEEFFKNVDRVRLEKEADDRSVDIFGRYLVYMIAIMKDGSEVNYNVECVRQGYSPYFNKYGDSKRFHNEFVEAQNHARSNNLGIWDPAKSHYPDYEERLQWWDARAKQLNDYENRYKDDPQYFNLASEEDFARLADYVGKEIVVFGGIGNILTERFPYILRIPHTKDETFELIIREKNAGLLSDPELDLETKKEYYVYVKGVLGKYKDRYQIELESRDQFINE